MRDEKFSEGGYLSYPTMIYAFRKVFVMTLLLTFAVTIASLTAHAEVSILEQNEKITVRGTVKDDNGSTIPGVTVLLKGTTQGTVTNIDGEYSLDINSPEGAVLVFSFVGMQSQEVTLQGKSTIDVILGNDLAELEEVVVVAYGTRKKGTIAGSVSTVKSEQLEAVPAAGFDQALQGSTPGLTVMSASGEPSKPASFQIRGTNSINSGTSPLFILDGVQISSSDFNAISPGDIESVSVLKDASSTSIYGARAANGVVVITTKRGAKGAGAKVQLRAQGGISQIANNRWTLMNTAERIQYEKEIGMTSGKDYDRLSQTDINWGDMVFNSDAPLQNYELSVSGASDKINYFFSGNVFDQQGITMGSSFARYTSRANIELRASDKVKLGTNTMITYEEVEQAEDGNYSLYTPISASRFMLPYWNPYNEDGSLASVNNGTWAGNGQNPIEWMENNPMVTKKYKLISTLFGELKPIEQLTLRTQLGFDYTNSSAFTTSSPSYLPNVGVGSAGRSSFNGLNLSITNTIAYNFDINKIHKFNVLLGQEGINYTQEGFSLSTRGQINDELVTLSTGTAARSWSDFVTDHAYLSFFGRGEYNYQDTYYADFSLRTDGSSRFGKNNRWATFWSLGFMWNAGKTDFIKQRSWISSFQIAMSTGTSGNSSIPNYDHLALVTGNVDYYGQAGIAPMQRGSEDLSWEKLWSSNLGFRLGILSKANLNLEFYNKITSDMLMSVPITYADGGFGNIWSNVGVMANRGVELALDVDVLRRGKFRWNISANASYNHNRLLELYDGIDEYIVGTSGLKLAVGHSVSEYYSNRFAGVNPNNGDALWYTKDGEITTEFSEDDRVMTGKNYMAPWQGGFGTTITYANLTLTTQFSWMADRYLLNNDRFFEESNGLYATYNQSKRLLYDRWKEPGDITDIPRHGVSPFLDDRFIEDASFLRLKNVMLTYNFPASMLKRTSVISKARVYAQAQNLFTWTAFSGFDPETNSNLYKAQYPLTRQFTFGLEVTF